ncbi:MAG: hypothetical protein HZA12_00130 [Nitrospirae bacterium]|nr:hypothetical protein [Nitrospirota bacterium]
MELPGQRQLQIEDYIEIILRRKWFIIIPFAASIIGIIIALIFIPPLYKSTTLILVEPQKVPEAYVNPTITADIKDRLSTITQQVMSRTRLESVVNEFNLYQDKKGKTAADEIVEVMRSNIVIDVKGDTKGKGLDSFTIAYIGYEPETVMHVTNRLASLFIEENLKVREQQAEGTTEFLDAQLQGLKTALESQEVQIKAFKEKFMGELPSQLEANLRTLDRLQLELQINNDSLRSAEDRKIMLERQLTEIGAAPVTATGRGFAGPPADPLRVRLANLQVELSQLSSMYTDKYPDIVRIKNEIADIEVQLKKEKSQEKGSNTPVIPQVIIDNPLYAALATQLMEVSAETKNLKEKQREITKNIAVLQGRVERIPAREQQMAALMRDYENSRANYQSLLNKKLDAQLAENLEKRQKGEQFRILDPANLPTKPFKPDPKKIILIGLALGLGSGFGLTFLLEYIDASFRKAEDVYAVIGIPVLASVPRIGVR